VPAPISRFGPPIALMGVIFFLSAQPDLSSGLGDWDLILRKLAHMTEYGLLALLWWRALGRLAPAVAITLLYAVSDEFHQSFVDGRHGSPVDVLIDATGVLLAIVAFVAWRRRRGGSATAREVGALAGSAEPPPP
jgi:VanZ family protein